MAYWWVFQGDSYKRARKGGYLWAPRKGARGQRQTYWTNMTHVQPGDVIFSGVDKRLVAISTASAIAVTVDPPDPRDIKKWPEKGWRVEVSYVDVPPIPYESFRAQLLPMLPARNAPFNPETGKTNLGYLYELPTEAGEFLESLVDAEVPDSVARAIQNEPPGSLPSTTRKAVIEARVGQGPFRDDLMKYWGERCAISECKRPEMLRASHIKPWTTSNHLERLDKFNGLLLWTGYDAAFDSRLITFSEDGKLILAADFSVAEAIASGIDPGARLRNLDKRHLPYLAEHRRLFEKRAADLAKAKRQKTSQPV